MFNFLTPVALFWLLLVSPGKAISAKSCSDVFYSEAYVTFDKVGQERGPRGGTMAYLKKRPGQPWESRLRVNEDLTENNSSAITQGNPAFIVTLLGHKKAKYWGFGTPHSDMITLPDAQELQLAIKQFNSLIPKEGDKIQTQFYESDGEVPLAIFQEKFLEKRAIPISKSGILSVHDRSVHSIHAFIDPRFDRLAIARMKSKQIMYERLKNELPEIFKKEKFSIDFDLDTESGRIDAVSAAMTDLFTSYISNSANPHGPLFDSSIARIFLHYLGSGRSPQSHIKGTIARLKNNYDSQDPSYRSLVDFLGRFDQYAKDSIPDYTYELQIAREDVFDILLNRIRFIYENTPEQ